MDNGTGAATGFGVGGFLLGMLAGAVVGGVAALLLAPRPGPETRQAIMDRMSQMQEIVRSRAREAQQEVSETLGQSRP